VQVPGLSIRRGKRGDVYKFQMDMTNGGRRRTVYATLGRVDVIPFDYAVATCVRFAELIRSGIDPTLESLSPTGGLNVKSLIKHYVADLKTRGKSERYRHDVLRRAELYLQDWLDKPIVKIRKSDIRDKHKEITAKHGPRAANQTIGNFATAWKVAEQTMDADFPVCPAKYVRKNPEKAADYSWFSLDQFWQDTARVSPMLRMCWLFGLLSGLRTGNLCGIRREWVHDDRVVIPRELMKTKEARRGAFVLPLSGPMRKIVERTLAFGDLAFPESAWLFSSVSRDGREVGPFTNIRPYGKVLRHIHRTTCTNVEVHPELSDLLHDHAIQGIGDVYTQRSALRFEALLTAQEKVSAYLLASAPESISTTLFDLPTDGVKPRLRYRKRPRSNHVDGY